MPQTVAPFLMFEGTAEQAVHLYVSTFKNSSILVLEQFGPGEGGLAGTVKRCEFQIAGQRIRCVDSPVHHNFTFTPAVSLFVDCESEEELDDAFAKLGEGGGVLMPPNNYGFSQRFAWINDRFGVSWQLNFAGPARV